MKSNFLKTSTFATKNEQLQIKDSVKWTVTIQPLHNRLEFLWFCVIVRCSLPLILLWIMHSPKFQIIAGFLAVVNGLQTLVTARDEATAKLEELNKELSARLNTSKSPSTDVYSKPSAKTHDFDLTPEGNPKVCRCSQGWTCCGCWRNWYESCRLTLVDTCSAGKHRL